MVLNIYEGRERPLGAVRHSSQLNFSPKFWVLETLDT